MNTFPFFTVLVPLYNGSNFLEACLESILNQKNVNFECLICDDGSEDDSYEIVKKKIDGDSRFKLFKIKHSGIAVVRNVLLERARGKYIVWIDPDDEVEGGYFQELYDELTKKSWDVVTFNFASVDNAMNEENSFRLPFSNGKVEKLDIFKYLAKDWPFPSQLWNKVIKRSLYHGISFSPNSVILEDFSVLPQILLKADTFLHIDKSYYRYKRNPASLLNSKTVDKEICQLRIRRDRIIFFKENYPVFINQSISSWLISYFRTLCLVNTLDLDKAHKRQFSMLLSREFIETVKLVKGSKLDARNRFFLTINNNFFIFLIVSLYPFLIKNKKLVYKFLLP